MRHSTVPGAWRLLAALTAVLLSGCTNTGAGAGSGSPMARGAEWREPAEYSFVLDSRCSDQPLLGRFRISVADGVVGEAVGLDNAARNALAGGRHGLVPTLGWLLDEVDAARRGGADVAQVEFDTVDGHPVHIAIDFDSAALDDEECYTITDYAVLPRASNDPPDQH